MTRCAAHTLALVAVAVAAALGCVTAGRATVSPAEGPAEAAALGWRKGGYIPQPFVGIWKCSERNTTRANDESVALGEQLKRHGTISYSGHQLWLAVDHTVDKRFSYVEDLIWWIEAPSFGNDSEPAWTTKYKATVFEDSNSTVPYSFTKFYCGHVAIHEGRMQVLGNVGDKDCEAPKSPGDAHFIRHCTKVIVPWADTEPEIIELAAQA